MLAVLLLVLLNAFFVAAELALVRIRDTQLDALVAKGNRRAKMARHIVRNIEFLHQRDAARHHAGQPGAGLDWPAGVPTLLEPVLTRARRHIGGVAAFHFLRRRFQRADVFAHHGGRTRAEMDDHPEAVADGACGWRSPLHWFYLAFYPFNRLLNLAARCVFAKNGH